MKVSRHTFSVIGFASLFFFSLCSFAQDGPPPVPVETITPKVESVDQTIATTGVLMAQSSVNITTEIPGRIQAIPFSDGVLVSQGSLLYQLDDTLLQAELNQAQARFDNAKMKYDRLEKLLQSGSGNTSARDDALSELKVVKAQLEYIQTKIEQTRIKAPFSGHVGLSRVEVGDYVVPGTNMVNLEAMETLKVDFKIPELYLKQVKKNQTFKVYLDGYDESFQGTVTAIDPAIDARLHSLSVRGQIDNPENRLRPGLFVRIDLVLEHRDNALLVPETAIQFSQNGPFVYRIEDNVAHLVPVKTGVRYSGWVEILEGIQEGDQIVTSGQNRLYEGAKTYPSEGNT